MKEKSHPSSFAYIFKRHYVRFNSGGMFKYLINAGERCIAKTAGVACQSLMETRTSLDTNGTVWLFWPESYLCVSSLFSLQLLPDRPGLSLEEFQTMQTVSLTDRVK